MERYWHAGAWIEVPDRLLPLVLVSGNRFSLLCGTLTPLGAGPDSL